MINNITTAGSLVKTRSRSSQIIEWTLAGTMYTVLSYLTIACSVHQFYSKQRGLRLSNRLCTAASFLLLLSMIPITLEVTLSDFDDDLCTWITDFTVLGLTGSLYCVYLSLWFRQDAVYKQVRSNDAWVKRARDAGKVVVAGLNFCILMQAVGTFMTHATFVPGKLCIRDTSTARLTMICTAGLSLFQLGLVVLHILPLTNYFSRLVDVSCAYNRCARSAALCFVVDIAKVMAILVSTPAMLKYDWMTHGVFAFVLVVFFTTNVVALIFSFPDYGKRLFPFKEISLRKSRKIECAENPMDEIFNPKIECREKPKIVVTEV